MTLIVERKHRVLHLTLNRPEKRNALTSGMCVEIVQAVRSAHDDRQIGSIHFSAAGPVFCAGMDVEEAIEMSHSQLNDLHDDLFSLGLTSKKPIIMSVEAPHSAAASVWWHRDTSFLPPITLFSG